ncbi:Pkinase-domain-containing protein [Suillus clintonianus]|uniref:Pkinase-domain-containing protein n=1 Tax=Suillus clintonianus TaxID=1904413 RepID=UPI001B87A2DA|nr:Pkinase-domain-containing protein [Suillus clintonianus]KAG2123836.1 Pkinase-domain-containing protein [Suillus clintonianus]
MDDDEYPRLPRRNRSEDDPKMIGLWKVGRTIGKGSSGRVRIARHSKTGQYAAVKIVSKNALMNSITKLADSAEHMLLSIEREIVIMKLIDHPNIMRLYDVWETSSELYLILEYVEGGELFDYLCNKGRLSTFETLGYFQQIISAIDYCHRLNIAHRDLKPENLLMDQNKNIKVADFGMAAWQASSKNGLLQTACGSPHYAAPEVIMGKEYNGRASDIWSCGVILFALLVGRLPFDDEDLPTLLDKVKSGKFDMPAGIDPLAKDLITKMLQKDVVKRITIPEILTHPFYLSQKPKPVDASTPRLNDIARPLSTLEEIDQDILANLRTLWHGTSEEDIKASLKSSEPNWQKGVYRLLTEYRDKHLEDYDEDEEVAHRKTRKKKSIRNDPQGMARISSQIPHLARAPSFLPPRAAPPTPRRAAGRTLPPHKDDSDYVQLGAPRITFCSPTPPRPEADLRSPLSSYITSLTSPLSPMLGSTNLPAIEVPELKDDKMQYFFQQIVEHLNAMEARTAGTPHLGIGNSSAPPTPVNMEFGNLHKGKAAQTRNYSSPREIIYNADMRHERHSQFGEDDKENLSLGVTGPGIIKKSSLRSNDGDRRPALRVQIIEPPHNKLRKKGGDTPAAVSPAFSDSSFTLPSTPRRRWLDSVFRFKPVTYQLLSTHDGFTTREECRRMLVNMGVRVVLTHAENAGVLKCKMDETRDPSGILPALKSVRFRVEVQRPTPVQITAGYQVVLHLIQERGASSSFQAIYYRLRRNWELDIPRMLMAPNSPLFSPTETEMGGYEFSERLVYAD